MRLIELTANKPSFKTVRFNPRGPSFIVARQKDPEASDKKKTYNGVGKSLLVALVHFCLGSNKNTGFETALPDWEFSLTFEIGGKIYTVKRSCNQQEVVYLSGEKLSLAKLNEKLGEHCFDIPSDGKFLTWRLLLPTFIRRNRAAYVDFDTFGGTKNEKQKQRVNAFLLGIDTLLIDRKLDLREEQIRIKDLTKNFEKDDVLKDFFTGRRDVALSIRELTDQIKTLEKDLEKFEIADDYYDIKAQADVVKRRLEESSNKTVLLSAQIAAIDKSLSFSPDLGREKIEQVYAEAKLHFPDSVKSRLSDVEQFHTQLAQNRQKRLSEQKIRIQKERSALQAEGEADKRELDRLLQYLGAHQALDVFVSLNNKLADLRAELKNLESYDKMQDEYRLRDRELKERFLQENRRTEEYLKEIRPVTDETLDFFRSLSKRFYPNVPSGIKITSDDGENQTRFHIDAKIESDNSGGINNVKIFCYDLTLLLKRHNHRIDFLFHDSRLFDGVDERQKAVMAEVVGDLFKNSENQYIATMNENQLEEIRRHLTPEQFSDIIEKNTVLTLTDGSPEEMLLGIKIDLKYE